jgi:hypothetical protein
LRYAVSTTRSIEVACTMNQRDPSGAHDELVELPHWPGRTVAMLATSDATPHVIPVSAPVRANPHQILISLHRSRGSLARLRQEPGVALLFLGEEDLAFTARGRATVIEEPMAVADGYAAVRIDVDAVDHHSQPGFIVVAGVDREWLDLGEQASLRARVNALAERGRDAAASASG